MKLSIGVERGVILSKEIDDDLFALREFPIIKK